MQPLSLMLSSVAGLIFGFTLLLYLFFFQISCLYFTFFLMVLPLSFLFSFTPNGPRNPCSTQVSTVLLLGLSPNCFLSSWKYRKPREHERWLHLQMSPGYSQVRTFCRLVQWFLWWPTVSFRVTYRKLEAWSLVRGPTWTTWSMAEEGHVWSWEGKGREWEELVK